MQGWGRAFCEDNCFMDDFWQPSHRGVVLPSRLSSTSPLHAERASVAAPQRKKKHSRAAQPQHPQAAHCSPGLVLRLWDPVAGSAVGTSSSCGSAWPQGLCSAPGLSLPCCLPVHSLVLPISSGRQAWLISAPCCIINLILKLVPVSLGHNSC